MPEVTMATPVIDGQTQPVEVALDPLVRRYTYRYLKRSIDLAVAAFLLVVLTPLLCVLAVGVRLSSPGPILYHWEVVGCGGRRFRGYKFRSMVANADALKPGLADLNWMRGPVFKLEDDPRVTPFGRMMRRYSLDELPQLWSVVVGEMSLVGPRPAGVAEWPKYLAWQRARLSVNPGITCIWQTRGRNSVRDFDEWVRMDLDYIQRWSLAVDFRILLDTVGAVLHGTGR